MFGSPGFRAAAVLVTAACITLVVLLAQLGASFPPRQLQPGPSSTAPSSPRTTPSRWCAFGTLPGTWTSSSSTESTVHGTHWQLLSKTCAIKPLLDTFHNANSNATPSMPPPAQAALTPSEALPNITVLDPESASLPEVLRSDLHTPQEGTMPRSASQPTANIIFISDSVDRHVLTYLCQHAQGTVRAIVLKEALPLVPASGNQVNSSTAGGGGDAGSLRGRAGVNTTSQRRRRSTATRTRTRRDAPAGGVTPNNLAVLPNAQPSARHLHSSSSSSAPTAAAYGEPPSGYVVNVCSTPAGRLRLLGSYIPGVHPSGPFHKQRQLAFSKRIDHAAAVWHAYTAATPDIVVVSSTLWDLARASTYEPALVSETELPRRFLEGWIANYTNVVRYAKQALPQAKLWVFHTSITPRHDPVTGIMEKSYLGRANHLRQLNAAGRQAARELGMEVIDYAEVASRFLEGQGYLTDLIHPGKEVGLELANLYLNYVEQLRGGAPA